MIKKKLMLQYTVCYFSVFLLLFVFGSIIINQILKDYRQDVLNATQAELNQAIIYYDDIISSQIKVGTEIYVNAFTRKAYIEHSPYNGSIGIAQLKVISSSLIMNDLLFVNYQNGMFYTPQGTESCDTLAGMTLQLDQDSKEYLKKAAVNLQSRDRKVLTTTSGERLLLYTYPIPSSQSTGSGVVGYIIKELTNENEIQQILPTYRRFIMLKLDTGEVVALNNNVTGYSEEEKQACITSLISGKSLENTGYKTLVCNSELSGISLTVAIDTEQIWNKVDKIYWFAIFFGAALFFVVFVLIYLINVRNIRPIQKLQQMAVAHYDDKEIIGVHGNEIDVIRSVMEKTFQKQLYTDTSLTKFFDVVQNQLILLLFGGVVQDEHLLIEKISQNNVQIKGPHYAVFGALSENDISQYSDAIISSDQFNVFTVLSLGDRWLLAMIVSLPEIDDNYSIRLAMSEDFRTLSEVNGFDCKMMGFGMVYDHLKSIGQSYKEMLTSIEYGINHQGTDSVVFFDRIAQVDNGKYYFSVETVTDFCMGFADFNKNHVKNAFIKLMKEMEMFPASNEVRRFHCYVIVQMALNQFRTMNVEPERKNKLVTISTSDVVLFQIEMNAFIEEFFSSSPKVKHNIEDVLLYLSEHYKDSSIGLEQLSEKYNMSISSMSKYIKKKSGQGYSDYIQRLRMNEACRFLRETDMEIQEIVLEVGYFDSASFSKKFSKMFGISPSKYRDQFKNKDIE